MLNITGLINTIAVAIIYNIINPIPSNSIRIIIPKLTTRTRHIGLSAEITQLSSPHSMSAGLSLTRLVEISTHKLKMS